MNNANSRFGPTRVMMVCTGNICRSPMAEIVLQHRLAEAGLGHRVEVDSSAITSYEQGSPIDRRARASLEARGYEVPEHRARQIRPGDIYARDLILAMTEGHANSLRKMSTLGTSSAAPDDAESTRIRMFRSFDPEVAPLADQDGFAESDLDLADPWYGGPDDFELCLDQIEAAIPAIVDFLRTRIEQSTNPS